MAGFMNAALVAIRDNLVCGHCGCIFKGTDSQARKLHYESRTPYCSKICSNAAGLNKLHQTLRKQGKKPRKGVLQAPCKQCGNKFESKYDKKFCSLDCYNKSDQFKEMVKEAQLKSLQPESVKKRSENQKKGVNFNCLECGTKFYQKRDLKNPNRVKKFCNHTCYRSYFAKRFDRWIANPEGMALPQCYDEFLDKEELQCIVVGCDWKGKHLSLHMNQTHGVHADEFKRASGFNLGTGVIAKPLAKKLSDRPLVGVALGVGADEQAAAVEKAQTALTSNPIKYKSLEGKEHFKKSRALGELTGIKPNRICAGCGISFQQSSPFGRALYCSIECRSKYYSHEKSIRFRPPITCKGCNVEFSQISKKGTTYFCTTQCRSHYYSLKKSCL